LEKIIKKVKIKCMDVIIVNSYQPYYALLDHISSKNIVHKKPLHINLFQVVICNKKGHHIKLHKYKDGHHKKRMLCLFVSPTPETI